MNVKTKYILVTGNGSCIMTCKEKRMVGMKIISKPTTDDKRFIEQVKKAVCSEIEENTVVEKVTQNRQYQTNKKESVFKRKIKRY